MPRKLILLVAASTFLGCLPMFATGPSFHPDATLTGSSLTGWHTFGQAEWRAENGEVVATPKRGVEVGWCLTVPTRILVSTPNSAAREPAKPGCCCARKRRLPG